MKKFTSFLTAFLILIGFGTYGQQAHTILDFEDIVLDWNPYGGYAWNTDQFGITDNPAPNAVNDSEKVLFWNRDGSADWAGSAVQFPPQETGDWEKFSFQVYTISASELNSFRFLLMNGDDEIEEFTLNNLGIQPETWTEISFNISELVSENTTFNRILLQPFGGTDAVATFHFDNFKMTKADGNGEEPIENYILIANYDDVLPPFGDFAPDGVATIVDNPSPDEINGSAKSLKYEKPAGEYKLYGMGLEGLEIALNSVTAFEFQVYQGMDGVASDLTSLFVQFSADGDNVDPVWNNNLNLQPGWNTLVYNVNQPAREEHIINLFIFPNMVDTVEGVFFFDNIKIHVKDEIIPVAVTGVSLSETEITLAVGQARALSAIIEPNDATNQNVTWSVEDESIAGVSNGVVSGVAPGTTSVTVTTVDGGFTATCQVTVTDDEVVLSKIIANWDDIIPVPDAGPGVWQFFGGDLDAENIIDNPHPDAENPDGRVLVFTKPAATWQLAGFFFQDGYPITPDITSVEVLIYSEDIEQVFLQTSKLGGGGNLEVWPAVTAGQWNRISVPLSTWTGEFLTNFHIFPNPSQAEEITVYIGEVKFNTAIMVTGISLDITTRELNVGQSFFLTPTVEPADADNQEISWATSDESVATVNSLGQVTAVGAGTATITVTTDDGGFTATSEVTVLPVDIAVTGIQLDAEEIGIYFGETETLVATIEPANATNQNVTWSSSDESVATVDQNGLVTAVGLGQAIITVTTEDGGFSATSQVSILINNVENLLLNNLNVYPNPFREGSLNIETGNALRGDVQVRIYTITGTLAKSHTGELNNGRITISTSLVPGVYLLKLETNGHSVTRRLLVQ